MTDESRARSILHQCGVVTDPMPMELLAYVVGELAAVRSDEREECAFLCEQQRRYTPADDADERGPVAVVERRSQRADGSWGKWSMRHVFDTEQQARQFILGHKWSPEEQARVATYVRIPAPPPPPTKGTSDG